jgi:hypothetical protein
MRFPKYSLLFIFTACINAAFAQTSFRVSYSLPIVQNTMSTDTFMRHEVSYDIWQSALSQTAQSIKSGSTKIYDNMGKRITAEEVMAKLSTRDTVMILNPYTLEEYSKEILTEGYLDAHICGFSMNEKWTIGNDGMIEKSILRFAPLYPHYSCHKALYWIYPTPVTSKHQTTNVEYVVDFSSFENSEDSVAFVKLLMGRLLSGEVNASNPFIPRDKNPKNLSKAEIEEAFRIQSSIDTATSIDPVSLSQTTTVNKWTAQNKIDRIRFHEEWQIDGRGNFMKQVKEYELMTRDYDHHSGEFRGWMPFLTIRNQE